MTGFVWEYQKEYIGLRAWRIVVVTCRRQYRFSNSNSKELCWDEDVSARYISRKKVNERIPVYREQYPLDARTSLYAAIERIIIVAVLEEGELLCLCKDLQIAHYMLIHDGKLVQLASDFEEPVKRYFDEGRSVEWLLQQECCVKDENEEG